MLVIPDESRVVSCGPSDDSLLSELWQSSELPEKTHDWVRRTPDVVTSARSEKSSAVNILDHLLDLELLWRSIQGRDG